MFRECNSQKINEIIKNEQQISVGYEGVYYDDATSESVFVTTERLYEVRKRYCAVESAKRVTDMLCRQYALL